MSDQEKYDIGTLDGVVKIMAKRDKRSRRVAAPLIVLLMFDVVLTFAIGYGAVRLHTVTSQAEQESCHFGNVYRLKEKTLWEYMIHKHELVNLTPKSYEALQDRVNHAMKLRHCNSIQ